VETAAAKAMEDERIEVVAAPGTFGLSTLPVARRIPR
jgi:hypothetical protein